LTDVYIATPRAAGNYGARVGLRPGKRYTMDELWNAVFLPSANDAALAVAQANGGVNKTVRQMNEVAAGLQALDTVAKNTSGLDAKGQFSSAYDLALIARAGLAMPDFASYTRKARAEFPNWKGRGTRTIYTTNRLVLQGYPGIIGVKTGYTTKAGRTFVAAATRKGKTFVVALMGIGEPSEAAAAKLLNWAFKNHDQVTPVGVLVGPVGDATSGIETPLPSATAPAPAPPGATAPAVAHASSSPGGSPLPLGIALVAAAATGAGATAIAIRMRRSRTQADSP
jgi:D-alanyl-D-alanine carboxypeptidase (penicillin-binding protein 5/6)